MGGGGGIVNSFSLYSLTKKELGFEPRLTRLRRLFSIQCQVVPQAGVEMVKSVLMADQKPLLIERSNHPGAVSVDAPGASHFYFS